MAHPVSGCVGQPAWLHQQQLGCSGLLRPTSAPGRQQPLRLLRCQRRRPCRAQAGDGASRPGILSQLDSLQRMWRQQFTTSGAPAAPSDVDSKVAEAPPGAASQPELLEQESGAAQRVVAPEADKDSSVTPGGDSSWESWQRYFAEVDAAAQRVEEVNEALQLAVADEKYRTAASLQKQLDSELARDVVSDVMEELDKAIEKEDFEKAARLRDAGGAGLLGWWVAQAEGDPAGHLLHIATHFCRYVGYAYSARDVAEAKGWSDEPQMVFGGPGGLAELLARGNQREQPTLEELGSPVFEIFVTRGEDGHITLRPTVLRPPLLGGVTTVSSEAGPSGRPDDDQEQEGAQDEEGSVRISLNIMTSPDAKGLPEMNKEDLDKLQELIQQAAQDGGGGGGLIMSSMDGDFFMTSSAEEAAAAAAAGAGSVGEAALVLESTGGGDLLAAGDPLEMRREPAGLTMLGRNQFLFQAPRADAEASTSADAERVAAGGQASTSAPTGTGRITIGAADGSTSVIELNMDALQGNPEEMQALWARMAEEVSRLAESAGALAPGQEGEAEREALKERLTELVSTITSQAMGLAGEEPPQGLQGDITYTRIPTDLPPTDPFNGLYLGAFGPHGPELLHLRRSLWPSDGDECVEGLKLTGDVNVPAGAVSFRAKIGRQHRLDSREAYPPELGVTARYRGQGRVAQEGYKMAKWVEGELLVLSPGNPVTRGAQLGFVWVVPGEKRYLILLNRVSLD